MDILRISTAGSVDDGKSTLIGRLLYDTKSLPKDKIKNIEELSAKKGLNQIDFSLITDGLTAEREQGITIDVAHIYFNTPKRKYIVADTPGHIEYTRNMITGASNSQVFIILIDARVGIIEQTKRHLFIASLMEIKHIVFVINKMDLVGYEKLKFNEISDKLKSLKNEFQLENKDLQFIPISAKIGDNVVKKSQNMNWYGGSTLLEYLENVELEKTTNTDLRFDVQYVIRPQNDEFHDFRSYAGKIKNGNLKIGDSLKVLSSGVESKVKSIRKYHDVLAEAKTGDSISIELEDDIDISRSDMLVHAADKVLSEKSINASLCWLDKEKLNIQKRYLLRSGSSTHIIKIKEIKSKLNFEDLTFDENPIDIDVNSISKVNIVSAQNLFLDHYKKLQANGSFILVDEVSNATVAVGFKY